jgi:hypothetical protein
VLSQYWGEEPFVSPDSGQQQFSDH